MGSVAQIKLCSQGGIETMLLRTALLISLLSLLILTSSLPSLFGPCQHDLKIAVHGACSLSKISPRFTGPLKSSVVLTTQRSCFLKAIITVESQAGSNMGGKVTKSRLENLGRTNATGFYVQIIGQGERR